MAQHEFKPGDVVQLKSGGPLMTVSGDAEFGGGLSCTWFAGDTAKYGDFRPELLQPYTPVSHTARPVRFSR